jgi:hypothetical protein
MIICSININMAVTSQIYPRSQLIIFISLFYFVCSLHVSALTGHPQVKHTNIIYIFMRSIMAQHIRYFLQLFTNMMMLRFT